MSPIVKESIAIAAMMAFSGAGTALLVGHIQQVRQAAIDLEVERAQTTVVPAANDEAGCYYLDHLQPDGGWAVTLRPCR